MIIEFYILLKSVHPSAHNPKYEQLSTVFQSILDSGTSTSIIGSVSSIFRLFRARYSTVCPLTPPLPPHPTISTGGTPNHNTLPALSLATNSATSLGTATGIVNANGCSAGITCAGVLSFEGAGVCRCRARRGCDPGVDTGFLYGIGWGRLGAIAECGSNGRSFGSGRTGWGGGGGGVGSFSGSGESPR